MTNVPNAIDRHCPQGRSGHVWRSTTASLVVVLICGCSGGCRSLSSTPDKKIIDRFSRIDALEISGNDAPVRITDRETIQKLRELYEHARWKPFLDTVPADTVAIKCLDGDRESFRLLFGAGWLMEWEYESGVIRKSVLGVDESNWIRTTFGLAARAPTSALLKTIKYRGEMMTFERRSADDEWEGTLRVGSDSYAFSISSCYEEDELPAIVARAGDFLNSHWDQILTQVTDEMLPAYNDEWRVDDPPRDAPAFRAGLGQPTISVWEEEAIAMYFPDGGMFGGHSIEVFIEAPDQGRAVTVGLVG